MKKFNHITACGVIYRQSYPVDVFLEVKDDGYPIKVGRRQGCFIGGNWIGQGALNDKSPLETFRREFMEELSFDRPIRDSVELALLGVAVNEKFEPTPNPTAKVSEKDYRDLEHVKNAVVNSAVPFGDFVNTTPKEVLDRCDPANTREGFSTLASYYQVPLDEESWNLLVGLQNKFNNLSNESITLVTSLSRIIASKMKVSFGHDRVLRSFFLSKGLMLGHNLPIVPGIESCYLGHPLISYEQYLSRYEIIKRPR